MPVLFVGSAIWALMLAQAAWAQNGVEPLGIVEKARAATRKRNHVVGAPRLHSLPGVPAARLRSTTAKEGTLPVAVHRDVPPLDTGAGDAETLPDGTSVWRMALHAPGALGIRLHFSRFRIDDGLVRVYAPAELDPDSYERQGPFGNGQFWTRVVFGDTAIVEYETHAEIRELPFQIDRLSHIFHLPAESPVPRLPRVRGLFESPAASTEPSLTLAPLASELSCHLDVSCYPDWSGSSGAVGRIFFEEGDSGYVCSGALLNTRSGSGKPYFLTAKHCIGDNAVAQTVVAYFGYQTSGCNAPAPALSQAQRVLGAKFIAGDGVSEGDFSLLELTSLPPRSILAGWEASDPDTGATVTTIHHPDGDFQRITFGVRTPDRSTRVGRSTAPAEKYLRVREDRGRTEGGSSGAPLFSRPGVIVGQLSHGPRLTPEVACATNPESGFGRLAAYFPRLKPYLDDSPELPESDHPYPNSIDRTWTYTFPRTVNSMEITFDERTEFEPSQDFLHIADGAGAPVPGSPFTGRSLAGKVLSLPGNTVRLRLVTDPSIVAWGFRVTRVVPVGDARPPVAPSNLTAAAQSTSEVLLTWKYDSADEARFAIERRSTPSASWQQVALVPSGRTTYRDTSLTPGTTYTYRVRAENGAGASGWSNEATVELPLPLEKPTAARLLAPENGASFGGAIVGFFWSAGTLADSYFLAIGSRPGEFDILSLDLGKSLFWEGVLPTDGRTLYVRLFTIFTNGSSDHQDYTFSAAGLPPAPQ